MVWLDRRLLIFVQDNLNWPGYEAGDSEPGYEAGDSEPGYKIVCSEGLM